MEPATKVVSSFFVHERKDQADQFLDLVDELNNALNQLQLPKKVECVYNPTVYARNTFEMYVRKYCNTKKPILYFGMNPGPWGMSQTGVLDYTTLHMTCCLLHFYNNIADLTPDKVPFGEVTSVRDWLGIQGPVGKPPVELPNRLIQGFNCRRSEVSGTRFWGLMKQVRGTPDNFFRTSFIYNYLPHQWMKSNGANVTPSEFSISLMTPVFEVCDPIFIRILQLYEVKVIVAVGKFCESRAQRALKAYLPDSSIQILYLPHPSPRAVNNTDWEEKAFNCLKNYNLLQYYSN